MLKPVLGASVTEGGTLGRCLGREGGALVNGTPVLIKGPESPPGPPTTWGHREEKAAFRTQETGPHRC